ncbi:IclR family transcriptional regulator [Jiangella asiatica]|uniref:IclR family transcriptional regulator n=1 Tax=Jiangella asiatica TaxID=2530372 RepID=UPI0013A5EC65|nr:IclR family transcriptional regulator [Jiangella asiatica]
MPPTTLQSVRRALAVLEVIAYSSPPTAKDVAVACDLELATTYHLLNTLIEAGYVEKDDRRLFPTGRLVELGAAVERRLRPDPALIAAMERLTSVTGETTYLSEWLRGDVVAVGSMEGTNPVRVGIVPTGERGFAHARASGKVLLAFGPPERLEVVLKRGSLRARTANTITRVARLEAEIEQVHRQGYAVDRAEYIEGVCCIAAPISESTGFSRYCLAVLVPATRFADEETMLIEAVTTAAAHVRVRPS